MRPDARLLRRRQPRAPRARPSGGPTPTIASKPRAVAPPGRSPRSSARHPRAPRRAGGTASLCARSAARRTRGLRRRASAASASSACGRGLRAGGEGRPSPGVALPHARRPRPSAAPAGIVATTRRRQARPAGPWPAAPAVPPRPGRARRPRPLGPLRQRHAVISVADAEGLSDRRRSAALRSISFLMAARRAPGGARPPPPSARRSAVVTGMSKHIAGPFAWRPKRVRHRPALRRLYTLFCPSNRTALGVLLIFGRIATLRPPFSFSRPSS